MVISKAEAIQSLKLDLSTNDMTENDVESWIAELEAMAGIKMKIKVKKNPTS